MSRIWTLSDLHLTLNQAMERSLLAGGMEAIFQAREDADLCIIAGDVTDQGHLVEGLSWVHHYIGKWIDTYVVLGNHDYFGSSIPGAEREARAVCKDLGMHLVANDCLTVSDDLRIAGGTLWTDFSLYDKGDGVGRAEAMVHARHAMEDFSTAIDQSDFTGAMTRGLTPAHSTILHEETVNFLRNALSNSFDGATVVVTHHAPHPGSVVSDFSGDPLSAAFASNLSELIEELSPELWIHGHTHASLEYTPLEDANANGTLVVCNPRASRDDGFDWGKIVEVHPKPAPTPSNREHKL